MRKNFGSKPWTYPQPVYIIGTYDTNGKANVMNAAWGGISSRNSISFSLSKSHKTIKNLKKTQAFTVSIGNKDNLKSCDYVGLVSGNKEIDKFEKAGFHEIKSENVNAPIIKELPMSLECKVISYNDDTEILTGEIVNVSADESILTDGKIDPIKLNPIVFDPVHMAYRVVGEKVGDAYKDGKELDK